MVGPIYAARVGIRHPDATRFLALLYARATGNVGRRRSPVAAVKR
jgi:hypothetical protein